MRDEHLRAAIVRALEALEDGDQAFAAEILVAAEEAFPVCDPTGSRRRCPQCGAGPLWPGELATHQDFVQGSGELPCAA